MPLEDRVELDISEALRGIDTIEAALTAATQTFSVGLVDALSVLQQVAVGDVDASAVTTSIDSAVTAADTNVPLQADGSVITAGLDEAIAAADKTVNVDVPDDVAGAVTAKINEAIGAADTTVHVEADTGDAEQSLDQVAGSASHLADAGGEASGKLGLIGPAAALAVGETGALSEIVGHLTPGLVGAAGATVGLVGAGKELFTAALEQNTALARLREQFGPLAEAVEHVNLSGFNESLDHLAVRTGGNVDGLRNFAASFAQVGKSSGDSVENIAKSSQEIILLATRASVANPALGTSDEIVNRLSTSLARGGRFLSNYGISLTAADITQEALKENVGKTSAELTVYERAVAGATLATQQLGPSLRKDIDDGSQKAEVQLRALKAALEETFKAAGAPLIQPTVDVLQALLPIAQSLATILGTTLSAALHVVVPLFQLLAPILGVVADVVQAIPTPLLEAAAAFLLVGRALPVVAAGLTAVTGGTLDSAEALSGLAGPIGLAVGALVLMTSSAHSTEDAVKSLADKTGSELADTFERIGAETQHGILPSFHDLIGTVRNIGQELHITAGQAEQQRGAFKKLAEENPAQAQVLINALKAEGKSVSDLEPILSSSIAKHKEQASATKQAQAAIDDGTGTIAKYTQNMQLAAEAQSLHLVSTGRLTQTQLEANAALHTGTDGATDWVQLLQALDPAAAKVAERNAGLATGLGDVRDKFDQAKDAATDYQAAIDKILNPILNAAQAEVAFQRQLDQTAQKLIENKGAANDRTKAGQDDVEAVIALTKAGTDLIDKLIAEGATTDVVNAKRQEVVGRLQTMATLYPQLRDQIGVYIGTILSIPDKAATDVSADPTAATLSLNAVEARFGSYEKSDPSTTLGLNTDAANANLSAFELKLRDLSSGKAVAGLPALLPLPGGGKMAGGNVPAGWAGWVGENGPELWVAPAGGRVLNHNESLAAVSGSQIDYDRLARTIAQVRPNTFQIDASGMDPIAVATAVDQRQGRAAMR